MTEKLFILSGDELDSLKNEIKEIKGLVMDGQGNSSAKVEGMVTADVAAEMLHISRRTLYTWTKKRILPVTRIGRKCLYRKKAIEALIARNELY